MLKMSTVSTRVYNLGNTQPHTVTELVDVLERSLGRLALRKVVPVPPTGDVLATFANVSAASRVGGCPGGVDAFSCYTQDFAYKPSVALEDGLKRFVLWFMDFYGPQVMAGRVVPRDWVRYKLMVAHIVMDHLSQAYDPL